mmetsp:Transcript_37182/g.46861  ORF Transcript_37182/g.46861 Transcript_37182/m.46861 type:complete len:96 (+) Transcript_37182:130-417(+)
MYIQSLDAFVIESPLSPLTHQNKETEKKKKKKKKTINNWLSNICCILFYGFFGFILILCNATIHWLAINFIMCLGILIKLLVSNTFNLIKIQHNI